MPHGEALVRALRARHRSFVDWVVELLRGPLAYAHTLLAVCPNSVAVVEAALEAAAEANAPLLFAATLNQVDLDGGYTGWTPHTLAQFVAQKRQHLALDLPVVLGLDHGGPWKKDVHARDRLSFQETFRSVLRTIEACLDAGYGLLHLDPTVDLEASPGSPIPIDRIVERTVALLQHAESYRQARKLPPVAYEVGTEECITHASIIWKWVESMVDFPPTFQCSCHLHRSRRPINCVKEWGGKV